MFTIDVVIAAALVGASLGMLFGHTIGYGKGKQDSRKRR